jgi:hypothetical protein
MVWRVRRLILGGRVGVTSINKEKQPQSRAATRNEIFTFTLTVLWESLRRNFSQALRAPGARSRSIAAHDQILRANRARRSG